jgi:hypothetical protein
MCGRYTVTIDKSTIEKRFGGRFYIARQEFELTFQCAPAQARVSPRGRKINTFEVASMLACTVLPNSDGRMKDTGRNIMSSREKS